jgi:predicted RNA binding protein YcfA (HicA-like mRNA interferase family)
MDDSRQPINRLARLSHALLIDLMVVIITTMRSAELIKLLEAEGWRLRGVRGSHHVFNHPQRGGHISVPHPKKDLGLGLVHKLLKQAGLKG